MYMISKRMSKRKCVCISECVSQRNGYFIWPGVLLS